MKNLTDKTILITGAGGGFGREMVQQFLREGSHLVLCDLHHAPMVAAAEAAARHGDARGRVLGFVEADLSQPDGAAQVYSQSRKITPQIDMLVNNAGIGMSGRIDEIPPEKWERLMQINLLAPMRLTALVLPEMIARRSGHIVNVSSLAGIVGSKGLSNYCASKFGLRGFGEALIKDVRPYNIDVTTIYPFFARTPILESERFGSAAFVKTPSRFIYEPDFVVAELIKGIKAGRHHIYPGAIPRWINRLQRWLPALATWVDA